MFGGDVSPESTVFGSGDPDSAVVGSVHGDEPTGVRAIHRVLEPPPTFDRPVKFVVANPPAAVAHRRYLDVDMNRVFPGDADADERERRLAAQLVAETDDCTVLSIHTTRATSDPVAFVTSEHRRTLEVVSQLPLDYVVNERPTVDSAFSSTGAVSVEVGKPERDDAIAKAEEIIRAFLRVVGAVDEPSPPTSSPAYFTTDDTIEKPGSHDSYELLVENFERVEAGTAYAKADGETLVADESFVPILVSETGYDDIFGYRGHRTADSLDGARDAWLGDG
ncbi:succinylglutamate desuccinylase [Halorussus sp. AFM4]|uniref:succinylglutamate desuccinylase n=1 Tax=Halorussus sp. AFM4 TaxID=3421651 RepID=UPI003EB868EC